MTVERQSRSLQRSNKVFARSSSSTAVSTPSSYYRPQYNIPVHRSLSATNLKEYNQIIDDKYRPVPYLCKYHDTGFADRGYGLMPKFWPTTMRARHYHFTDPSYNYYFYYPALSMYPKYSRISYSDNLDPRYWRRYRDPYYDQPLWFPNRPWVYESYDAVRGINMFKRNLITYNTLQKYWIQPTYSSRNYSSSTAYAYRPVFWHTSPRPYSYFYDVALY